MIIKSKIFNKLKNMKTQCYSIVEVAVNKSHNTHLGI